MLNRSDISLDVCRTSEDLRAELRADARAGLGSMPKWLRPKWFYDERGSELYDEITRLESYYPFRREHEILVGHAADIARATDADTLVEIGSGTSEKTRMLLDAFTARRQLRRFVPFDVAESTLMTAAGAIAMAYPSLDVHAVVGDFERDLACLPTEGRRMVAFLGGTIGNMDTPERARFLEALSATMRPGDTLLLGTDLVKDPVRLVAAYDEPEGVTAAFNLNVLQVLNRELGADFDLDRFSHVARYDSDRQRIEMLLRADRDHVVHVAGLGMDVEFAAGELMLTEISTKFRRDQVIDELAAGGLAVVSQWTDPFGDYALTLASR